jgi:regulator of replication initiation timing
VKGELLDKGDLSQLLHKVSLLESKLNSEAREKTHLAEEVAALREENQRLQVSML